MIIDHFNQLLCELHVHAQVYSSLPSNKATLFAKKIWWEREVIFL